MKKNHEIRIKLSKEEHDNLKKKVDDAGTSISHFVRFIIKKSTLRVSFEE